MIQNPTRPLKPLIPLLVGVLTTLSLAMRPVSAQNAEAPPTRAEVFASISRLPLNERIPLAPAFTEPLEWTGPITPSPVESEALWRALETLYQDGPRAGFLDLEVFLETYPDSAWAPSLRHLLAQTYEQRGRYGAALAHWEQAWEATRWGNERSTRRVADAALTGWARLLAGLGQIEKLETIVGAVQSRQPAEGRLRAKLDTVLHQYLVMRTRPEGVFKCGLMAVTDLARDPERPAGLLRAMMMTKAPAEGFSLAGLSELAASYGHNPRLVRWKEPGTIPVPSVAHLAVGHFVAVTAADGNRIRMEDAGLQRRVWMDHDELTTELSGHFLVAGGRLPEGCLPLSTAAARKILGRGVNNTIDDGIDPGGGCVSDEAGDDTGCPPEGCVNVATGSGSGTGGSGGCTGCGSKASGPSGLPEWSVSEPFVNVWVTATPMTYPRADGTAQAFTLRYNQRDPRTTGWGWGFGPNWEGNRLSYIERDGLYTDVTLQAPGGGRRRYLDPQSIYFYYEGSFEYRTRSRMECDYNANGEATAYRVIWPNGAINTYGFRFDIWSNPTRYFLTAQTDPAGRTTTYTYALVNSHVHLTSLRDRDGLTTSFTYGDAAFPHQVTQIHNSTRGLSAQMLYDASGRLVGLVNALGVTSTFTYSANNWIAQMTTPLGATAFQLSGINTNWVGDPAWAYNRSALITEPDGTSRHLFAYRDGSYPAADPLNLLPDQWPADDWPVSASNGLPEGWGTTLDGVTWMQYRNSYYWNPHQYNQTNPAFRSSNGNLSLLNAADFRFARLRHWLHQYDPFGYVGQAVSDTLSMQRDPSPDGADPGQSTWYDYEDLVYGPVEWEGTFSRWPALIARVMPDGSSSATRWIRNLQGHVTLRIDFWRGTDNFDHFRTNRFAYAANGVDLIAHFGPGDQLEAGYAYDPAHPHQVVAVTNALNEVTRHFYDTSHRLTGTAQPSGAATTNRYVSDRLERTIEFLGTTPLRTNLFTWQNGQLATHTDPRGLTRTFTHDSLGRVTRIDYSADGTYETFGYVRASDGQPVPDLTEQVDRMGRVHRYTYTPLRQVESETDPLGRVTRYTYCACGGPDTVTRAYGSGLDQTTHYTYDVLGRVTITTQPDGTSVTNWFDRPGRLVLTADAFGSRTNYYDNLGRLWVVENAAGVVVENGYDDHDRVLNEIDGNGVAIASTYDALGRVTSRVTAANGASESWSYAPGIHPPVTHVNPLGHLTRYAYDAAGRKVNEVQVGVFTNRFTYTPAGELATLADGKGNVTTWKYDAEGRVKEKWYQGQSTADLLYWYDSNGQLTQRFTRTGTGASTNGYFTSYSYDAVGNLSRVAYPTGTPSITNWFDAHNRLIQRLDGLGATVYTYTMLGTSQQTWTENGPWASDEVTVTNRYGRRAGLRIAQPAGQFVVTTAWDSAGRWKVVGGTAGTFTYGYPATTLGGPAWTQPTSITLPGGGTIGNSYDSLGRLTRTELRSPGGTILNAHGYGLDAANQRTVLGRTNGVYSSWNGYLIAGYDSAGQLTQAWTYKPNGTAVTSERWSYGYDPAQNLSKRTNNTSVETFTVNALNQLTTVPNSTPTYDRRGNLVQRYFPGGPQYFWYYTYDHENQLTSVATDTYYTYASSRFKVTFAYDGQGRMRVRRDYTWGAGTWYQIGETRYLFDGMLIVQERNGSNTPTVTYTRGRDLSGSLEGAGGIGGLLARSHGYSGGNWTSHNAYHADGNGNVTALANSAGVLQASYRYDPYGRYLGQAGPLGTANAMRYSSKPWVAFNGSIVSGLYYYGYRYYDPYLQRWLNRDPIGEEGFGSRLPRDARRSRNLGVDARMFVFVRNAPTREVDWFGLFGGPIMDAYAKRACEQRGGQWMTPAERDFGGDVKACATHIGCGTLPGAIGLGMGMTAGAGVGGILGGPTGVGVVVGATAGAGIAGSAVAIGYAIFCNSKMCYYE